MKTVILVLSLAWLLIPAGWGQQSNQHTNTSALRGVWKQVESKPASGEASKPGEPGLAIFTTRHYSLIESRGDRPAPELGKMTDADKIKLFDTLLANAGTYEFDGTTLTRTVQVAKNQSVVGNSMSSDIVLSGNRFVETLTTGRNKGGTFTYERVE